MANKIVFLDIDGVLNGHEWCHTDEGPRINFKCARYLEIIVQRTGAKIVLISSWRSWINRGIMSLEGFSKVLLTHGCDVEVIDVLPTKDHRLGYAEDRTIKILDWITAHEPKSYVVLDDLLLKVPNLIRPNPREGLIPRHITEAVDILGKKLENLREQYPEWFQCPFYGFGCDDGWCDLIRRLCEDIQKLAPEKDFRVLQVKEKFGGLRFYASGGTEEIRARIAEAENESYQTCEHCGTKEDVTTEGDWVLTLCKNCRKDDGEERD